MLISVIVISYNSESYIKDCLDSIYIQDYTKIELIISDDFSTDSTNEIVRKWVNTYGSRFIRCKIIHSTKNSGVSANCNRGLNASSGKWVKFIAADDFLYRNDTITTYVNAVDCYREKILCSNFVISFNGTIIDSKYIYQRLIEKTKNSPKRQLHYLLFTNYINASTVFMERETLVKFGGYDESISMVEDLPMWIKYTSHGYSFRYINQELVAYRIHKDSLVSTFKREINLNYYENQLDIIMKYKIKYTNILLKLWLLIISCALKKIIKKVKSNQNAQFENCIYKVFKRSLTAYLVLISKL